MQELLENIIAPNSHKLEKIQISINRMTTNEMHYILTNGMLFYSEYSWTIATCNKLNDFFKHNVEPKKARQEDCILSMIPSIENPENSPQN